MILPSRTILTVGTAVMILGLGMPYATEAGGSRDTSGSANYRQEEGRWLKDQGRYHDDADVYSRFRSDRSIYSTTGSHNKNRYDTRDHDHEPYFTDIYGDLDTMYEDRDPYPEDRFTRQDSSSNRHGDSRNIGKSDQRLKRDILDELGEGTDRVRVYARNGVVTLSGMVLNREAMVAAVEDAYEAGARKVRNEMVVFRHEDRPWANMSDRKLAREVRDELSWSPFVDNDPIRVNVWKGVVTLEGAVEDRSEMAAAVENAYEAGARRVENRLRIAR